MIPKPSPKREPAPRAFAREAGPREMFPPHLAPTFNGDGAQAPALAAQLPHLPAAAHTTGLSPECPPQATHGQTLELIRAVFRDLAHDLNNALAPLLMGCSVLRQTATDAASGDLPAIMESAAQRAAALVNHLVILSSAAAGPRGPLDPAPIARRVLQMMHASSRPQTRFQFAIPARLWPVAAEPLLLEQLLLAACLRARHVVRKGGSLTVSADNTRARTPPASPRRGEPGAFVRFRLSLRLLAPQTAQSAQTSAAAGRSANPNGDPNSSWHEGLEVMARELGGIVKTSPGGPGETHLDLLLPAMPTPLPGKAVTSSNH